MSTLETSALAVGVVCLGVFLYIHFKVIPDLVKNTDDKAGNKKKMMDYSLANAVLFVVILICAVILGATRFCSSGSDKAPGLSFAGNGRYARY